MNQGMVFGLSGQASHIGQKLENCGIKPTDVHFIRLARAFLYALFLLIPTWSVANQFSDVNSGLVGYWSFDDGTAKDSSGNGNNGTANANVTYPAGHSGKAAHFGGYQAKSKIEMPSSPSLQFTTGATFSTWIKLESVAGINGYGSVTDGSNAAALPNHCIFGKRLDGYGFKLCLEASKTQGYVVGGPSSFQKLFPGCTDSGAYAGSKWLPTGEWAHIAWVMSSTQGAKTYVNGALYWSTSCNVNFANTSVNSEKLVLGYHDTPRYDYPLAGLMDEVRVYNRAISDADVQQLYNGNITPTPPVLSLSTTPASLSFSDLAVGTTSTAQTITLKNTGSSTVSSIAIQYNGDFPTATTCGNSLAAGASCIISVAFAPTVTGDSTGVVNIYSDATSGSIQIPLSGRAVVSTCGLSGGSPCDVQDIEFLPQYQTNAKRSALFSYGMAKFAAKVAGDAYGDTADVYAKTLTANGFTIAPLVQSSGKSTAEQSLQAVVATKNITVNSQGRRIVLIAFRGTTGGLTDADWSVNLSADPATFNAAAPGMQVHGGFLAAEQAFEILESSVMLNGKSLKQIIGEASSNDDLFLVTGHSLGGAITTLYAARLLDRGINRDRMQAYTFGAPSVGNLDFQYVFFNDDASQLSKKMNLHRVRNKLDVVPFASYLQFLSKYKEFIIRRASKGDVAAAAGAALTSSTAELLFRDANDAWPYMHVGYMRVLDGGVDITKSYQEMDVFSIPSVLDATLFDSTGHFISPPDPPEHKISNYLSNLESAQGQQVSSSGVLDAQGLASGGVSARSINVLFNPAWDDIDLDGEVYLAALMPDGQLYFNRKDGAWILLDRAMGTNFPVHYSGNLHRMVITATNNINMTPYIGAKLYIGYRLAGNPASMKFTVVSIVR